MRRPASFALARASGFGGLPERVEREAGERVLVAIFEKEGLPLALRDEPMTPVPLRSMAGVFARAGAALDDRTFGLNVGERMTHRGYGLWARYCAAAPTLSEAIARVVATDWAHLNGAWIELAVEGGHRILRFRSMVVDAPRMQHSDHVLPPLLAFLRVYLGPAWLPDWVEVDYARDPGAAQLEERLRTCLRFARPGVGVALRASDLLRNRLAPIDTAVQVVTLRDVLADVILADAPEPVRALSAVAALRLIDGRSDIDGAARLVGLGVQGLQRRLREKGYTYREIIEEARRARAVRLLLETRMSVLEIALSLGYETHASFTRAFLRWTGLPPTAFRRSRG